MIKNPTYIICDLGCGHIKALHNGNKVCFPSRLGNILHLNTHQDIITYNNKSFTIGTGLYSMQTDKINRDYTLEYILSSAAKLSNSSNLVVDYLVIALPLNQFQTTNINSLKDNLETIKKHDYFYNNKPYTFEYNNVIILPEALSAYFYTLPELDSYADTLIIDVGGGTTDIIAIDTKGNASKPKTLNLGSIKLLQRIATYLESKYPTLDIIAVEKVHQYLQHGFKIYGELQDLSDAITACDNDFLYIKQQIFSLYSTEIQTSNVIVIDKIGLVADALKLDYPNIIHITDEFTNAYGMEIILLDMINKNSI